MSFTPKVALVTGASSGIGRITAEALSRAGYRVYGTTRNAAPADRGDVRMLTCDVTDQVSVEACVAQVLKEAGRIDLLVNNAGSGLFGAAEEASMAQAQQLFEANFFGLLRVTNAVLPAMRRQHSGRIVNVSSILGLIPAPFTALYAASKHAVEGYSESLDHEVRSLGIRVVLVEPAYTRTSFNASSAQASGMISSYDDMRARVGAAVRKANEAGDDASVVADSIVKAAEAERPRRRYTVGSLAGRVALLRRYVPAEAFDKSLRKQSGL
ncbi:oxidoreductase [Bosea sp. 124]|uniref:oxidoreductase n=1 Tax=Bosea sp. 124 TaxID=2135642 RepID=UPI000D3DC0C0|nr:oxidoreductase [Bosea sp. 124]PTM39484.1 short-subunit dehydrogenase [Bosea sp. 124]